MSGGDGNYNNSIAFFCRRSYASIGISILYHFNFDALRCQRTRCKGWRHEHKCFSTDRILRSDKFDSTWLTSGTNLYKSSGILLIAIYPDCNELGKARKSNQYIVTKFAITAPNGGIGKTSSNDVTEGCDQLRTKTLSADDQSDNQKAMKEFANGNSLADSLLLGVLEEIKGEVCYAASMGKSKRSLGM